MSYQELRNLAAQKMAGERAGHTLQPTALVHEAYLKLINPNKSAVHWDGRGHFFGAAAEAMRRILVDHARRRQRVKHGGDLEKVELREDDALDSGNPDYVVAVDEALTKFSEADPAKAQLVKLRFFGGLTIAEAAAALGISETTADRHWAFARGWLGREINRSR